MISSRPAPIVRPLLLLLLVSAACSPAARDRRTEWQELEYPSAERGSDLDTYWDVEVADPYRWLEDERSQETLAWIAEQDAITEAVFATTPRADFVDYLENHWYTGEIDIPVRRGDRSAWWSVSSGADHPILWTRKGDEEPRIAVDLNQRDPAQLASTEPTISFSPQGRYLTYEVHLAGADVATVHIHDLDTGKDLEESLAPSLPMVTDWLPDESAFFYTHLDLDILEGRTGGKAAGVWLHRIGTDSSHDVLIHARPWDGRRIATAHVAADAHSLLIRDYSIMGGKGGWGRRPLDESDSPIEWLLEPQSDFRFSFLGNKGREAFFVTDHEAPNWRIVALDLDGGSLDTLREVVAESPAPIFMEAGEPSGRVVLHEDRLHVTYIHDNSTAIRSFDLDGRRLAQAEFPFPGMVSAIGTRDGDPNVEVGFESYLVPRAAWRWNTLSGELTPPDDLIPEAFAGHEPVTVFYHSKDGTRIPLSLLWGRDTPRDGSAKVLLYGYGGWGIPILPEFSNRVHAWLERGGLYAVPNIRGGVEYGEAWHRDGQLMNKQNVFDDFASAAEYLIAEGHTTADRITILGASNGGLLTAASYNQRPELFGAVISEVAAVDLLRFVDLPIGQTLAVELGSPNDSPEMLEYLLSYSPIHNVRSEPPYPPLLSVVGENDPRCKPGHIYKFVAATQRQAPSQRLSILRVVRGAGHGSAGRSAAIDWYADELAFAWAMTAP